MATALPNNPDLECSICLECFNTPKVLPCGHSFCLECLERYVDGRKGSIPCPSCQQNVEIPRGDVNKLITNISLKTLTESLKTIDISKTKPSTSPSPKHHCPNHSDKEVEYYCAECSLGLCSKCILKDHKDHKIYDLECDSTREMVVEVLSHSELMVKNKIEDLEQTLVTLSVISEQLKSFCDEACTKIREETEKVIIDLRKHSRNRQKNIKRHFDKNAKTLNETRQKVMTQIKEIKTDLDTSRPTTQKPTLTLINSLNKLQELLCENMKTDIPPVTYVEWREGSVKVCDILGSTETKTLTPPIASTVFKFKCKDIKNEQWHYSKEKCRSHGLVWSGRVFKCKPTNIKGHQAGFSSDNHPTVSNT